MILIIIILIVIVMVVISKVVKNNNAKKEAERQRLEMEQRERLERERREKEARLEAERRRRELKRKEFKEVLHAIEDLKADRGEFISTDDPAYKRFVSCRNEAFKDVDIKTIWNDEYKAFLKRLDSFIKLSLEDIVSHVSEHPTSACIQFICNELKTLKLVASSDVHDETISKLEKFSEDLNIDRRTMIFIDSSNDEYGNFKFLPDENGEEMKPERFDEEIMEEDLNRIESHFLALENMSKQDAMDFQSYKSIPEFLNHGDHISSICAMWYFAAHKPFDVSKFERACKISSWYINYEGLQSLETMIVRIYNWKSIGGSDVVKEYTSDILDWVENVCNYFSDKDTGEKYGDDIFYNFVSALAWMELYDLELEVLKKLVDLKVQLWSDAQERLKFLSSGGTANVKIYQSKDGVFSFDSSSVDWKDTEYDVFFRKLKMKNIQLSYSLVVKNWTKTYPLQNGQKYSDDALYHEFEMMVEDYDGEVTISKENASALNLNNLSYPNAVIFRFTSERNRCVTMLFHAEKFGRNLNITILTLFTAEKNLPIEELQKYAVGAKNNVYTDSFKEAILESLDEVLKIKATVYDELEETSNSSQSNISNFFD